MSFANEYVSRRFQIENARLTGRAGRSQIMPGPVRRALISVNQRGFNLLPIAIGMREMHLAFQNKAVLKPWAAVGPSPTEMF